MQGYEKLVVWQKSMQLVKEVYYLTTKFPKSELFGIISQMRRASVSIPSNIAEGYRRGTRNEFTHFLKNSFGSGAELETQIKISIELEYTNEKVVKKVTVLLDEVMRLLNKIIKDPKLF